MSIAGNKQSTLGPDYSGKAKPGFFAGPTTEGLPAHHGPGFMTNAARPKTGNLARDGAPKKHLSVPIHNGCRRQAAGGPGHAQGAAPAVDDGGLPTGSAHPFAKEPSPQLAQGRQAPIAWSNGGSSMRNRNNDSLHGGATCNTDCSTGDAARELGFADPTHPNFRGKSFSRDCAD